MQLYGNGVTKNFLVLLESDMRRCAKSVFRLFLLAGFLFLLGFLAFQTDYRLGISVFLGILTLSFGGGIGWGHFVNTYRYQASIREHWNRWMRYSVSCASVRECYGKVHGRRSGPGLLWTSVFLALLILAHGLLLVLALNDAANPFQVLPLFALDGVLVGFMAGIRWRERRWYRDLLRSVNELLQEGAIGVWGVY